jgi:hypothetical protein
VLARPLPPLRHDRCRVLMTGCAGSTGAGHWYTEAWQRHPAARLQSSGSRRCGWCFRIFFIGAQNWGSSHLAQYFFSVRKNVLPLYKKHVILRSDLTPRSHSSPFGTFVRSKQRISLVLRSACCIDFVPQMLNNSSLTVALNLVFRSHNHETSLEQGTGK